MFLLSLLSILKTIEGPHEANSPTSLETGFFSFLPDTRGPSEIANITTFYCSLKMVSYALKL